MKSMYAMGIMTGTSMDGIDVSLIKTDGIHLDACIENISVPFSNTLKIDIQNALGNPNPDPNLIETFTRANGDAVLTLQQKCGIKPDIIGFHGQTLWHQQKTYNGSMTVADLPQKNRNPAQPKKLAQLHTAPTVGGDHSTQPHNPAHPNNAWETHDSAEIYGSTQTHYTAETYHPAQTYQMGDGELLSRLTKCDVVYDFRTADTQNGGEGAPFIPIYHQCILNQINMKSGVFINIGGVSNITHINNDDIYAGDIGPGSALIDDHMRQYFQKHMDENGDVARTGTIHHDIIDTWMTDVFFTKTLPKSLDRNHFVGVLNDMNALSPCDKIATLTAFTARSILHHVGDADKIFVCGGGRHNAYLMDMLNQNTQRFDPVEAIGFDGDFIESQGFAYMAVRRLYNLPISFPTTTGVISPTIGGVHVAFADVSI